MGRQDCIERALEVLSVFSANVLLLVDLEVLCDTVAGCLGGDEDDHHTFQVVHVCRGDENAGGKYARR